MANDLYKKIEASDKNITQVATDLNQMTLQRKQEISDYYNSLRTILNETEALNLKELDNTHTEA